MRPRGSITGPIILILIGIVFLIHAFMPSLHIGELLWLYWPYLLIAWGVIAFLEVTYRTVAGAPIPANGVSGGAWFLIILICIVGFTAYEIHRPGAWWVNTDWGRGFNEAFGEEHDYSIGPIQKTVIATPHVIIEAFHGDARVVGADGTQISVSGHKTIRAVDAGQADRANSRTPVDVIVQGATVIIRCNQDKADSRTRITTDLDISVPRGATLEATGNRGDFDISALNGNVDVTSANAGVRIQDVNGDVKVDVDRSDVVRCTNVNGAVDLRGHGSDLELTKIAGQVAINGEFRGTISLRELSKPLRFAGMRTHFDVQQIPGEVRMDRGSFNAEGVIGPLKLNTHATDITLAGFTNAIEVSVDRGDIDLRPERLPLGAMTVHTNAGNIELTVPPSAQFAIAATTNHGDIDNQFGGDLKQRSEKLGSQLNGSVGSGPEVDLTSGRGTITVRKGNSGEATSTVAVSALTTQLPQAQ
ncbi:MAG: DUF4097 family beta strand repeat protein [Acidobacteriaceae bacterium]|nr:DUF4097 family beta strand repeat protein [Acidobacteriaceae bacterium]